MNAEELVLLVRRRIESRYQRILFVQKELNRLNALAKLEPALNTPAQRSFDDFVFSRINFSVYKKIETDEFNLLFLEGLGDYEDAFYLKMFSMNREEIRKTINNGYVKAGPFYLCRKPGPLLLSIMRTLHTSLEFAPVLGREEIAEEEQIMAVAEILNGQVIRHDDGTETRLFMPKTDKKDNDAGKDPILCGTFYPLGKACTIVLI